MTEQYSLEDWQALAEKSLRGKSLSDLTQITANGLQFDPLYSTCPAGAANLHPNKLQRWDNRLRITGKSTSDKNAHALLGLNGGISSLEVHCSEAATTEANTSLNELDTLLKDVRLDVAPISVRAGVDFKKATDHLCSLLDKHTNGKNITASINADPYGALVSSGYLHSGVDHYLADMATVAIETAKTHPLITAVCVDATPYHNAGATIEQELVSAIATAATYMEALISAGLNANTAANTIVFQMACDADHLANTVKLRSLKQLWHHLAIQFAVDKPQLKLVVETSQRMQSKREPWVNHLRNASAASAAAMGGAQAILVHPHNFVGGEFIQFLETDSDATQQQLLADRVARNIPNILADEAALQFVHDPMAGAYSVETLTAQLNQDCWQALQHLESKGGLLNQLESGEWQASIAASYKARIDRLTENTDIAVGVNRFNSSAVQTSASIKRQAASDNAKNNVSITALPLAREASAFEDAS